MNRSWPRCFLSVEMDFSERFLNLDVKTHNFSSLKIFEIPLEKSLIYLGKTRGVRLNADLFYKGLRLEGLYGAFTMNGLNADLFYKGLRLSCSPFTSPFYV